MSANSFLSSTDALLKVLLSWSEAGWIRPLDEGLARFLSEKGPLASSGGPDPLVLLGAALASHQLGRGHACLDLEKVLNAPEELLGLPPPFEKDLSADLPAVEEVLQGISLCQWKDTLANAKGYVNAFGDQGTAPLICVDNRLYLYRYWAYEQTVATGIAARLTDPLPIDTQDGRTLKDLLTALFPSGSVKPPDLQKVACAMAAGQRFFILTGGPGTGKTRTVLALLAVLQSLALNPKRGGRALSIRLAAPTGKAAARLSTSMADTLSELKKRPLPTGDAVLETIPTEVTTVHRLLGSRPDTRHFQHNRENPLRIDVLVVDEASMVDLEKMACIIAALPPAARLILVGDKDQLVSVEAGSVLGELCQRAHQGHYTPNTLTTLTRLTGELLDPLSFEDPNGTLLDQAIVALQHSFRFPISGPIGQLAHAVNQGNSKKARAILDAQSGEDGPISVLQIRHPRDIKNPGFKDLVLNKLGVLENSIGYMNVIHAKRPDFGKPDQAARDLWAKAVLDAHKGFQLLCVLRKGPFGVQGLNATITQWLRENGSIAQGDWYEGRPVIATQNDYSLGLMNGDIGITLNIGPPYAPELRVAFEVDPTPGAPLKWVRPTRLPTVETVYALTVHKSQGSEFKTVALILPPQGNPVLTRELIYTGITRTQEAFILIESEEKGQVFESAIEKQVMRSGGLHASLVM
jgi:exodeoxyribonuclease V alpha subunit